MPNYVFRCLDCDIEYEELTNWDESEKWEGVKCPKCDGEKKEHLIRWNGGMVFDKPKESSKWDNWSYRAGYNYESAKADRRNAAGKSHMGTDPYPNMS